MSYARYETNALPTEVRKRDCVVSDVCYNPVLLALFATAISLHNLRRHLYPFVSQPLPLTTSSTTGQTADGPSSYIRYNKLIVLLWS